MNRLTSHLYNVQWSRVIGNKKNSCDPSVNMQINISNQTLCLLGRN